MPQFGHYSMNSYDIEQAQQLFVLFLFRMASLLVHGNFHEWSLPLIISNGV